MRLPDLLALFKLHGDLASIHVVPIAQDHRSDLAGWGIRAVCRDGYTHLLTKAEQRVLSMQAKQ